jgi:hypothetical protein
MGRDTEPYRLLQQTGQEASSNRRDKKLPASINILSAPVRGAGCFEYHVYNISLNG